MSVCWSLKIMVMMVLMVIKNSDSQPSLPQWKRIDWGSPPLNTTDFTTYLWFGFSSNKVSFTQHDLQRLAECMLGHGHCPPIENSPPVKALTNCYEKDNVSPPLHCRLLKACTTDELLSAYRPSTEGNITIEDLRQLLPAIIYIGQKGEECNSKRGIITPNDKKPSPSEVWGYGILFVTLISGCSLAGVSVLPLMAHKFYQQLLTLLVGLAVGSLAASSLFHLIPQAFKLADKDEHHSYLFVSLTVLLGIWSFFMVERFIKIIVTHQARKASNSFPVEQSDQATLCTNMREPQPQQQPQQQQQQQTPVDHCQLQQPHSNGYSTNTASQNTEIKENRKNVIEEGKTWDIGSQVNRGRGRIGNVESGALSGLSSPQSPQQQSGCGVGDVGLIYASQQQAIRASFGHNERPDSSTTHHHHSHALEFHQGEDSVIRTVAWMIIFGDGFHNFIDGVSIGAAFSESILTGISISLAVMCEELPHELGDFAVLLNAGMTMKQAVSYNFLSATTCYLGLALGILLGEFTQDNTAVFAVAAGMFLYIALVDMVPEMNEVASKAAEGGWKEATQILMYQNIGIFIGIASLFCLAYFQDTMVLT